MRGVRWTRNGVHHQWADALRVSEGFQFPMRFPLVFHEWVWRAASALPVLDRPDPHEEAAYREHLEGRPAEVTLAELGHAFGFLAQLLEPPRPYGTSARKRGAAGAPTATAQRCQRPRGARTAAACPTGGMETQDTMWLMLFDALAALEAAAGDLTLVSVMAPGGLGAYARVLRQAVEREVEALRAVIVRHHWD